MTASDFQAKHMTSQSEMLIENIDRLHTTTMGVDRIKRNLKLDTDDAVGYMELVAKLFQAFVRLMKTDKKI